MNIPVAELPVLMLYNLDRTWPHEDQREATELVERLSEALAVEGHPVSAACLEDQDLAGLMANFDPGSWIVFNWCEEIPGLPRSSSGVAETLEQGGFTFTGADSTALRLSQDKPTVKRLLDSCSIPTPRWRVFEQADTQAWDRFPAIVKPAYEHYSLGITCEAVVLDASALKERVEIVIDTFKQPALVEQFLPGREFHVSIVGNGRLEVFPIAEMDFSAITDLRSRLCTYDSKFDPQSADYQNIQLRLPAELTEDELEHLQTVAVNAYLATGCRDYARLDIRQQDDTFYVLDINPNADLSPDTSLALSAGLAGYTLGGLSSRLVRLAASRHTGARISSSWKYFHPDVSRQ